MNSSDSHIHDAVPYSINHYSGEIYSTAWNLSKLLRALGVIQEFPLNYSYMASVGGMYQITYNMGTASSYSTCVMLKAGDRIPVAFGDKISLQRISI